MERRHRTIDGTTLHVTGTPEELAYLDRVEQLSREPAVTPDELVDVMYAETNPVLVGGMIPGRGAVTAEVAVRPLFRAMRDLENRKYLAFGRLRPPERRG